MIDSIAWVESSPPWMFWWKWYLCGFWLVFLFFFLRFNDHKLFFSPHFSLLLFTTSHSSHMLKFMTSFQSHEIKSLGFIFLPFFPPWFFLFSLAISLALFFSFSHFSTRRNAFPFLIVSIVFHTANHFRSFIRFFFSSSSSFAWSIFRRELSLLLLFIFKRLPNTRFLVHALLLQFLESI